jgi:hypothetical protein
MKYKTLKFGKCYINKAGDFAIGVLCGDKKHGYQFAGTHAHPYVWLGQFQLESRIVPNDGNWKEIEMEMFNAVAAFHVTGNVVEFPEDCSNGELPKVTQKYTPL